MRRPMGSGRQKNLIPRLRRLDRQLRRLDRVQDRQREQLADALLAEVVEVQAVAGDELRVRHAVVVPGAHDGETKQEEERLLYHLEYRRYRRDSLSLDIISTFERLIDRRFLPGIPAANLESHSERIPSMSSDPTMYRLARAGRKAPTLMKRLS